MKRSSPTFSRKKQSDFLHWWFCVYHRHTDVNLSLTSDSTVVLMLGWHNQWHEGQGLVRADRGAYLNSGSVIRTEQPCIAHLQPILFHLLDKIQKFKNNINEPPAFFWKTSEGNKQVNHYTVQIEFKPRTVPAAVKTQPFSTPLQPSPGH
jgi:hypothetical protein